METVPSGEQDSSPDKIHAIAVLVGLPALDAVRAQFENLKREEAELAAENAKTPLDPDYEQGDDHSVAVKLAATNGEPLLPGIEEYEVAYVDEERQLIVLSQHAISDDDPSEQDDFDNLFPPAAEGPYEDDQVVLVAPFSACDSQESHLAPAAALQCLGKYTVNAGYQLLRAALVPEGSQGNPSIEEYIKAAQSVLA